MNEIEFWEWLESEVERQLRDPKNRFLTVHPNDARPEHDIRATAAKVFRLRDIPAIWNWQTANQERINATLRRCGKRLGLRLLPPARIGGTYARFEIAQSSNSLLKPAKTEA